VVAQSQQGSPRSGSELQGVGVAQVVTGDLPDPLQPVLQRAAVDHEELRGGVQTAATFEIPTDSLNASWKRFPAPPWPQQ
jgi:hypothetical protein